MNINTTISYAQSPFRVHRITATASTNNDMLFTQQQKYQLNYKEFKQEYSQHYKIDLNQKILSKLDEEKLKELSRMINKNHNPLKDVHFVDIWY